MALWATVTLVLPFGGRGRNSSGEAAVRARGDGGDPMRAAVVEAARRLGVHVGAAGLSCALWSERIEAGVRAALAFLEDEPHLAQLLAVDQPQLAVEVLAERLEPALVEVLEAARVELIIGTELRPARALIAELVVCASLSAVRGALSREQRVSLRALAPSLTHAVVDPYLERGAQRADFAAGRVEGPSPAAQAEIQPIRPTRAHLLALGALADTPGLRNREITRSAGLSGSGEASHLLHRLSGRGLIENVAATSEPKTWALTFYGERVLELLHSGGSRRGTSTRVRGLRSVA